MNRRNLILTFIALVVAASTAAPVGAQRRDAEVVSESSGSVQPTTHDTAVARTVVRDDLAAATEKYKFSLRELLVMRETELQKATNKFAQLKDLYTSGLISRREFEASESDLAAVQTKVDDLRHQLEAADQLLAESQAETDAAIVSLAAAAPSAPTTRAGKNAGTLLKMSAYVRHNGTANWSLADAPKVDGFFLGRFGRRLPVSAFGQSELHNRWGYDHRHAMDVGVHPDSPEGEALMNYLRTAGIPFIAFRRAVPGSASGPHIHIGRPSHKTISR